MPEPVRIGVVGAGVMGRHHVRNLAALTAASAAEPAKAAPPVMPVSVSSANYTETPSAELFDAVHDKPKVNPVETGEAPKRRDQSYVFAPGDLFSRDLSYEDICRQLEPALARRGFHAAADAQGVLYIADGHHRSAAASRVAAARGGDPNAEHHFFLAVSFPHDQVKILDYNRLLTDLNGLEPDAFLARVGEHFECQPTAGQARPTTANEFGMYLRGQWYRLTLKPGRVPDDPVGRLDVSLLHHWLIEPVLGVSDPRRDKRIDFVGGIRGLGELERRVDSGEMAVAFALYATSLDDLMAVADAGQVMPPKSTWFEPKLADGMVSHLLD